MHLVKWVLLCLVVSNGMLLAQDRAKQTIENFDRVQVMKDLNSLFKDASATAMKSAKQAKDFSMEVKELKYSEGKDKAITEVEVAIEASALIMNNMWDKKDARIVLAASAKREVKDGKAVLNITPSIRLGTDKERTDSFALYRHLMHRAHSEKNWYGTEKNAKGNIVPQSGCTDAHLTWTQKGNRLEENEVEFKTRQRGCGTLASAKDVTTLAALETNVRALKAYGVEVLNGIENNTIRRNPHFTLRGAEAALFRRLEISLNQGRELVISGDLRTNDHGAPFAAHTSFRIAFTESSVVLSGNAIALLDANLQRGVRQLMSMLIQLSNPGDEGRPGVAGMASFGLEITERLVTGEGSLSLTP